MWIVACVGVVVQIIKALTPQSPLPQSRRGDFFAGSFPLGGRGAGGESGLTQAQNRFSITPLLPGVRCTVRSASP
jgi:hypothetical protein